MSIVYEKYKIDSTRFAISNIYYTSQVDEYEEIFEEVEKRLEVLQSKYQNERDSIIQESMRKENTTRSDSVKILREIKN